MTQASIWSKRNAFVLALLMPVSVCFALSPDQRFHQYIMDSWSIEQGLPQITVQALAQDGQGYIWAGTQAGLARFDGVRFENFDTHNTPETGRHAGSDFVG